MKHEFGKLLTTAISRRKLLETSGKAGFAATIASTFTLPFSTQASSPSSSKATMKTQETIKHSACLVNCGSRCALKVIVEEDRIVRIEPEDCVDDTVWGKHQIRPCLRGRSNKWRVYHPDRLKYPLKRVGKRGEGKFKRISWQEATELVAQELKRITEQYGNEAIYFNYQSGAYYHTQGTPAWKRLLVLNGGYLNYHNTYSTAQIRTATKYTYGAEYASHFMQTRHSDLVVFFGLNISETRMSGGGQVEELRRSLAQSNAKVIIIDPRYTDSVIQQHAEWLAIKPTTDAALIAALVHTFITENLIDENLINRYSVGYDSTTLPASAPPNASYKDYVLGQGDDKTIKTPEWAAKITGIPATRIRHLAREISGAKACFIAQGWGPQRHANGEQTARAIQTLTILSGHFGLPGTNTGDWAQGKEYDVPTLPIGANPVTVSIPCYLWTDAIATPEKFSPQTMGLRGAEKLNTGIKFFLNQAGNVLINQHGNIKRTMSILQDDKQCEFVLVIDNHMTPSAKFADLLLPETSYLEVNDLVNSSYASGAYHYMVAMEKTITPMWEVRSTYDVCADIAGHLGLKDQFTQGLTQDQWVEKNYQTVRESKPYLPEWNAVKGSGVLDQQLISEEESIGLLDFRRDPISNPLPTPSGKVEIYSEAIANIAKEWILESDQKITPIAEFCIVSESHLDKNLIDKYPLQMIGFHTKGHTHSTYANVPQLQEAVPNEVWINPIDADKRAINHGDRVHIFNDRGTIELSVKVTNRIIPGVVAVPQGVWVNINAQGVDIGGCINILTTHKTSPLAKGNPQHTNLVEIKRL